MNRRSFISFISVLFVFPLSLFGKTKPKVVGFALEEATTMNIPKKFSPTAQRRTVEIVTQWFAPAGLNRQTIYSDTADFTGTTSLSIRDLRCGDLFRLREPDGSLVVVDGRTIFKAISNPFPNNDAVWNIIVER
jgi:hypothetical protein